MAMSLKHLSPFISADYLDDVAQLQITVVIGLHPFTDSLTKSLLEGMYAARVDHSLLDLGCLRAPIQSIQIQLNIGLVILCLFYKPNLIRQL